MELGFDKLSTSGFKDISYEFAKGKITTVLSSDKDIYILSKLLRGINYNYSGKIINSYTKKDTSYVSTYPEDTFTYSTIREEIISHLIEYGFDKEEIKKRVINTLKIISFSPSYLDMSPLELSSGEKKLLQIALSLSTNPKVLIMDNPTIYLDSMGIEKLKKILKRLKKDYHKTIIIFDSNPSSLLDIIDNYVLFKNKKIYSMGTIKELLLSSSKLEKAKIDIPRIIEFVDKAHERGINLDYTYDIKELMKDIYRSVK